MWRPMWSSARTLTIDELFEMGYEAVFIGSGAGPAPLHGHPRREPQRRVFRQRVPHPHQPDEGLSTGRPRPPSSTRKNVAVVGGGNVAMDAARCAKRLGAENVYIVYRRGMEELPARKEEVEHAEEEGIIFKTLSNPVEVLGDENGYVKGMVCHGDGAGRAGRLRPPPPGGQGGLRPSRWTWTA